MSDYTLVRSARRTVSLEITREGVVLVRAPMRMPRPAIDEFVAQHQRWIAIHLAKRREAPPPPSPEEVAALRRQAKEILPEKVAFWAQRIGVAPTGLHITSARTRFGSCSGKNSLSFSLYLMAYPQEAIDYVVVHELCHILHHDHSPRFYACVAQYLPDYKQRLALLKQK
jgi:predicted metal-dependent hydrolase